jgi:hypothetical protein
MRTFFILGNGFDINLGLNTRYLDFYRHYSKIKNHNEFIIKLKEDISSGIDNWSDLELAFGKYTSQLNNRDEFDQVYDDIVENLCDYLNNEVKTLEFLTISKEIFLKNLIYPELFLVKEESEEVAQFKNKGGSANWIVDIMTFNYTNAVEQILKWDGGNLNIGTHPQGKVILTDVQHIHGYTDDRLIMGVNDISQVANKDFHTNQDIAEVIIKPSANRTQRHSVDKLCEHYIKSADLICIFGSSLGNSDAYWWKLIGEQLRRNIKLIIFHKGEPLSKVHGHKPVRTKRSVMNVFLNKTELSDEEKEEYKKKIYIGLNTNIFSIVEEEAAL